jgi:hypothetical protein
MIFGYINIGEEILFLNLLKDFKVNSKALKFIEEELNKPGVKMPIRFDIYGRGDYLLTELDLWKKALDIGNIAINVWKSRKKDKNTGKIKARQIAFCIYIPHIRLKFETDGWDLEKNKTA